MAKLPGEVNKRTYSLRVSPLNQDITEETSDDLLSDHERRAKEIMYGE